uniref:Chromosome 1 open reading frame 127 n=1 Tax=Chinchilla lanigera TaxID=34839 RepID=A0A8C2V0W5_CHILA
MLLATVPRAICVACIQHLVFPQILPLRAGRERPRPVLGVSTDKVECFSDYMTLPIPRSHVAGLRRWLGRILQLPGTLRAPGQLDSLLAQCGYFLHPAPDGNFIFRALYSACFVRKERENYRLEIRMLHQGVKRLERSVGYVMKCPATVSRLGRQSVHCDPTFIRVSRPLPLRSDSRQNPWLLSLRGELVASLEDASLMGLYVDISTTMVTVQSPRQDLLQRQAVLNKSVELLPLWLVSGGYAYSLEAACPPVSSRPGSEVLVHIPRQRLGLVKRGSHFEEALSLKSLQVHQASTSTVTESKDFVVVSIPAAALLQAQPCQEPRGAPGTQAFYSVDLSLEFTESATPVLWTAENYFRCVGSETELPASAATLKTPSSRLPPEPETPPAGSLPSASSQSQDTGPATLAQLEPGPVLQTATERPTERSWVSAAPVSPGAPLDQGCPQAPLGETGLPQPSPASATLSSGPPGAVQAGPRPSQRNLPASTASATYLSSEASFPPSPSWRSDPSEASLGSGQPVTPTTSSQQDPAHSPGSPLPAGVDVAVMEPTQAGKEFQPSTRPRVTRLAEESGSPHSRRLPQETSPVAEAERPPESGRHLPGGMSRESLDRSSPRLRQGTEGPRLTTLPGTDATFFSPGGWQPDTGAGLGTLGPEPPGRPRISPAGSLTGLPESPVASTSKRPATPSVEGSDRAPDLESAPEGTVGWPEWGTRTPGPLPLSTLSLQVPAGSAAPSLAEPGNPFPAGHRALPPHDPPEAAAATSPENRGPPKLLRSVERAL